MISRVRRYFERWVRRRRLEQRRELREVAGTRRLPGGLALGHDLGRAERGDQVADLVDAALDDPHRLLEAALERHRRVDRRERRVLRRRVEHGFDGGADQRVLVVEHSEDRAFRDARGLRNLARGDGRAVLHQQGHGGGHERGAALVGGKGRRPSGPVVE
jgi:hypothetical protein